MNRHLFLTGPIGCGKSTLLRHALGPERLNRAGGFLTIRRRRADGSPVDFVLMDPRGTEVEVFLDLSGPKPRLDMEVFSRLGVSLLEQATAYPFVILDEIGGIELLCPEFTEALDRLLSTDVPIIGVLKGEGPASAMVSRLGLTKEYEDAAKSLRDRLCQDTHTSIYYCGQLDTHVLSSLTARWVKEYCP